MNTKMIVEKLRYMLAAIAVSCMFTALYAEELTLEIKSKYLNLPVSQKAERSKMSFTVDGRTERSFVIRLTAKPEYWVFCDMTALRGKTVTISFEGNAEGLHKIFQADTIVGQSSLYREANRPQFHFTTKRGWNNDPNGLVYHQNEYHLFYQHNPYEREWENMHWGHAVSKDLLHWIELPDALSPDEHGTMFSGSAVIDHNNTSGFGKNGKTPMVAIYTADGAAGQVQCIAYSLDNGRTWTKYSGNPVINSGKEWNTRDTRDPKVFWHKDTKRWVMTLNERDGHSIYTSPNLREWTRRSHTTGFWECPDLFELPVDNKPDHTCWVMYGASGTYMIGSFDGETFTPTHGKFRYMAGEGYAAQTFDNTPDGRRIQIAWGRIQQPDMPFNMMMLAPVELTLRTTPNGLRLFSYPVKELDRLHEKGIQRQSLNIDEANALLKPFSDAKSLRIKTAFRLSHATSAGLKAGGQNIIDYDMNFNRVNGYFYSPPNMTSMELTADILIDRTSIEVFLDGGAFMYSMPRTPRNTEALHFWSNHPVEILNLEVYPVGY